MSYSTTINTRLKSNSYNTTDLLRFTTAGSVDDGKSTLIGRLLYDSKSILDDQLESIKSKTSDHIDLARLTDGLRSEREQGITIDIAYRYFASDRRKFIIADSPGHVEYTRNMVTAASNSELAVVLVDAVKGFSEQSWRHVYVSSLLEISHLVLCVNKMDLVDFSRQKFAEIVSQLEELKHRLNFDEIEIIPISAYYGDNVVTRSNNMPWYKGPTLIEYLENVSIFKWSTSSYSALPIQYVVRNDGHDTAGGFIRGYAGTVVLGTLSVGDPVVVLPGFKKTKIKSILADNKSISEAGIKESVVVTIEDDLDIGRGDVLLSENHSAYISSHLRAKLCWMDSETLVVGRNYILKANTQSVRARVTNIISTVDLSTLTAKALENKCLSGELNAARFSGILDL